MTAGVNVGNFVLEVRNAGPDLGLYIVDQTARDPDGAIGVTSTDERITFTFRIPAA